MERSPARLALVSESSSTDQTKEAVSEISEPRVPGEGHVKGPYPKVGGCVGW